MRRVTLKIALDGRNVMRGRSLRVGGLLACSVLSPGVIAGATVLGSGAWAQTAIVDPSAPKSGQSSHDAALAAAARRDYVAALDLSKKAAAEGQPLEADQVDFITGKAAQQQALADEAAKIKAQQIAAQELAQKIEARQQKDYTDRAKAKADRMAQCGQQNMAAADFTSAYSAAQAQGVGTMGQSRGSGTGGLGTAVVAAGSPISNERPGNC
jgi:hypothetical protein